ncbi:Putative phage-like protein [Acinetobacter baumannii]|nr:Putative phage-like protein [Acinetobacter baumannii]AOX93736.1 Putative phage-like protein [Acinetobacter baumannii]
MSQPLNKISGANDIVQLKILSDLLWAKKNNVTMTIKIVDQIQKIMKGFYDKKGEQNNKGGNPEANQTKAEVELEIKKLELQKLQREVNPPEYRPPEEDYKLVLNPDEEIPNEPIL